ncbi:unnamed protein product [Ilex paraguariensis]|uniref:RING-type domain-containing protein n=1 Tax=Ilex paraguariensis TaxID=185542 RepID=A0ABC8U7C6_9AQUA
MPMNLCRTPSNPNPNPNPNPSPTTNLAIIPIDGVARRSSPIRSPPSLPIVRMTTGSLSKLDSGSCCSICMEEFAVNQEMNHLPCNHFFHRHCIASWLKRSKTCPLCRCKVSLGKPNRANLGHGSQLRRGLLGRGFWVIQLPFSFPSMAPSRVNGNDHPHVRNRRRGVHNRALNFNANVNVNVNVNVDANVNVNGNVNVDVDVDATVNAYVMVDADGDTVMLDV